MMHKMSSTQCLLVFVALHVGLVLTWDIAISTEDDVLSFYTNDTLTSAIRIESRNLSVLAYNEVHNTMLYVDKNTNNDTICGYDLTSIENKCYIEGSGRNIHGIAFDPVTERVFFTDTNERSINWISLKPGSKNNVNGNLLLKMDAGIPRDIVVDSCKGFVYWLNTNLAKPTIERIRFNGTDREVFETITLIPLNTTHTFEPNSLVIRPWSREIFWMALGKTSENITEFQGTLKPMDGKDKHIVIHRDPFLPIPNIKHSSNALSMAFAENTVYSFKYTQKLPGYYKTTTKKGTEFKKQCGTRMPISLVANYKIKDQIKKIKDCEALKQVKVATNYDGSFCVHGIKENENSVCKCTPGYTGERCEVSVCENYCFQGNCTFNEKGLPECSCNAGYFGERCEVNACYGYCLNNGDCSFNEADEPFCQCAGSYKGTRCETSTNDTLCNIPT